MTSIDTQQASAGRATTEAEDIDDVELTVIVTAHNRADLVDQTLESLARQVWANGEWQILLVDNDSTDATPEILDSWVARMPVATRVISATEAHSSGYARNTGAAACASPSVAFVDDDDVMAEGWVAAMGEALRSHQFVASRQDYGPLNDPRQSRHHTFQTKGLGKHFGVNVVDSAGSGYQRSLWDAVGGNDLAIGFSEDADLSLRINRLGVEPYFCADAVCNARLRGTLRSSFTRGLRRGRSEVQIFERHREHFGVSADSLPKAAARWAMLAVQSYQLFSSPHRRRWVEAAGRRIGRAQETAALRTWYP